MRRGYRPSEPRPPVPQVAVERRNQVARQRHQIGPAVLGGGGLEFEPPATAVVPQLVAELETGEVGEPQRVVCQECYHQAVAIAHGPLDLHRVAAPAILRCRSLLGLSHQPVAQGDQLLAAAQPAILGAARADAGGEARDDRPQPRPVEIGCQPAEHHRQALQSHQHRPRGVQLLQLADIAPDPFGRRAHPGLLRRIQPTLAREKAQPAAVGSAMALEGDRAQRRPGPSSASSRPAPTASCQLSRSAAGQCSSRRQRRCGSRHSGALMAGLPCLRCPWRGNAPAGHHGQPWALPAARRSPPRSDGRRPPSPCRRRS